MTREQIVEIIIRKKQLNVTDLDDDAKIVADLEFDALGVVQLLTDIEEAVGSRLPDLHINLETLTVGDIVDAVMGTN